MSAKLFLVDDDPIYIFSMKAMLRQVGFEGELETFENGLSALESIRANDKGPDIILLDINMPIMDGWEFLEAVQQNGLGLHNTNIYIVTSSISPDDEVKAKSIEQVDGFLIKPVEKKKLKKIISEGISH